VALLRSVQILNLKKNAQNSRRQHNPSYVRYIGANALDPRPLAGFRSVLSELFFLWSAAIFAVAIVQMIAVKTFHQLQTGCPCHSFENSRGPASA
jgi:hypothetical protein